MSLELAAFAQRIQIVCIKRTQEWGVRIPETDTEGTVRVWLPFSKSAAFAKQDVTIFPTHTVPPPPPVLVLGRAKPKRITLTVWKPLTWCKHVLYVGLATADVTGLNRALNATGRVVAASDTLSAVIDALLQPAAPYRAVFHSAMFVRVELSAPHDAATIIYRIVAQCDAVTWISCAHCATTPRPRIEAATLVTEQLQMPSCTSVADKLFVVHCSLMDRPATSKSSSWPCENTVYDSAYLVRGEMKSWFALAAAVVSTAPHVTPAFEPLRACVQAWHMFCWARDARFTVVPQYPSRVRSFIEPTTQHTEHALALYYWGVEHGDDATLPLPRRILQCALEMYLMLGLVVVRNKTHCSDC